MKRKPSAKVRPKAVTRAGRDEVAELRARIHELEEAVRVRDEFVAVLGHELKNPLTPLYLQAHQLTNEVRNGPLEGLDRDKLLLRLTRFSDRLKKFLGTLDRLLDVSRLRSGKLDIADQPLDYAKIVRHVVEDHAPQAAVSRSEVRVECPEQLLGTGDALRFEQICSNLITNAIRYGLGNPIDVRLNQTKGNLMLSIADAGPGISETDQEKIFRWFERGELRRHAGGFGVGLWVVEKLCTALGGSVELSSKLGRGSTFTVRLPLHTKTAS